jgi:hypothetical protein
VLEPELLTANAPPARLRPVVFEIEKLLALNVPERADAARICHEAAFWLSNPVPAPETASVNAEPGSVTVPEERRSQPVPAVPVALRKSN